LNTASAVFTSPGGITPVRVCSFASFSFVVGSCMPTTRFSRTWRKSMATTAAKPQPRFLSGWSSVFHIGGGSSGLRGSITGTHSPSPGAENVVYIGPTLVGTKRGYACFLVSSLTDSGSSGTSQCAVGT
jgi:hypothetical protein